MKEILKKKMKVAQKYGVNPKVFLLIFLVGFVPFYGGIAIITLGVIQLSVGVVLFGLCLLVIGATAHWLYIAFAGKGLRWYWRLIVVGVAILVVVINVVRIFFP